MSRKLLLSSIAIAATATLLGVGTYAKFSDDEATPIHSVQAGTMDLQIVGESDAEYGTFAVTNAKPGDHGHKQIHFFNAGNVDGQLKIKVVMDSNAENGIVEPEAAVDTTPAVGELGDAMLMSIDGIGSMLNKPLTALDAMAPAIWDSAGPAPLYIMKANTGGYASIDWTIPESVGNEIMSDSVTFHIVLSLVQV